MHPYLALISQPSKDDDGADRGLEAGLEPPRRPGLLVVSGMFLVSGELVTTTISVWRRDFQPVRQAVSYRELFTVDWFGVREKYYFRLEIYDRLRTNEHAVRTCCLLCSRVHMHEQVGTQRRSGPRRRP